MRFAPFLIGALLALLAAGPAIPAEPGLIALPEGTYRAAVPPNWDGVRRLPLLLWIHGYGQSSAEVMADSELVAAAAKEGVLFVVPDGANGSWSFVGAPHPARDDIDFLHRVVADAERRWQVDKAHVFAGGFSIGGSMVWDLACHSARGFAAFLPFSGGFWLPFPQRCEAGPVNLRHVHGMDDHTVPMEGRTILGHFHQGDIRDGFAILRAADRCTATPERKTQEGDLACEIWSSCGGKGQLELCLHNGDHWVNPAWLQSGLDWAMHVPVIVAR